MDFSAQIGSPSTQRAANILLQVARDMPNRKPILPPDEMQPSRRPPQPRMPDIVMNTNQAAHQRCSARDTWVTLNAGGKVLSTTAATLCATPSTLQRIAQHAMAHRGHIYLLDIDGDIMAQMLDYLRYKRLPKALPQSTLTRIYKAADTVDMPLLKIEIKHLYALRQQKSLARGTPGYADTYFRFVRECHVRAERQHKNLFDAKIFKAMSLNPSMAWLDADATLTKAVIDPKNIFAVYSYVEFIEALARHNFVDKADREFHQFIPIFSGPLATAIKLDLDRSDVHPSMPFYFSLSAILADYGVACRQVKTVRSMSTQFASEAKQLLYDKWIRNLVPLQSVHFASLVVAKLIHTITLNPVQINALGGLPVASRPHDCLMLIYATCRDIHYGDRLLAERVSQLASMIATWPNIDDLGRQTCRTFVATHGVVLGDGILARKMAADHIASNASMNSYSIDDLLQRCGAFADVVKSANNGPSLLGPALKVWPRASTCAPSSLRQQNRPVAL